MSALFGSFPLLAPEIERENAARNGSPLTPWGAANSYRNRLGGASGRGWILLLRSDLDSLGIDTKADLVFSGDQNKATLTLRSLHIVKAGVICPGQRGDGDGACWAEIADRRRLLRAIPIDKAYNLRDAPGSAGYYSATKNAGSAWTWTQLVEDVWGIVGTGATKLGAYPGLPFAPDGTPEGFNFYGGASALMALDAVLERLGCALKLDLIADAFSIVRIQSADATATAALALRDGERIWDAEPQFPTRGKLPQYVRVLFSKQRDTTDTTGGSPFYVVDVADASGTPAAVEAGTYAVIKDDMPALYAAGVLSNGAALATRAAERSADWYRIAKQTRVSRTYTGLWSDVGLRPGAQLQAEVFEERGDDPLGFRTSILSTDGEYDPRTGEVNGGLAAHVWEDTSECCSDELYKQLEWLAYFPAWFPSGISNDHAALSNLQWDVSGHVADAPHYGMVAGFDPTTGAAVYYDVFGGSVTIVGPWTINYPWTFNYPLTINAYLLGYYYREGVAYFTISGTGTLTIGDIGTAVIECTADAQLTGITGGEDGRPLRISVSENSVGTLTLLHEAAGEATPANRMVLPNLDDVVYSAGNGVTLLWSDTSIDAGNDPRWRCVDDYLPDVSATERGAVNVDGLEQNLGYGTKIIGYSKEFVLSDGQGLLGGVDASIRMSADQGAPGSFWIANLYDIGVNCGFVRLSGNAASDIKFTLSGTVNGEVPSYAIIVGGVQYNGATGTSGGGDTVKGGIITTLGTGGYTNEDAQDAVGTILTDTDTVNTTYNDGTPSMTFDVRYQMSITSDSSGIKLSGDSATPGNSKLYGTDGSGTKGWYAQPSAGATTLDALENEASVASAATTDLSTATGGMVNITGTTTITSFGNPGATPVFRMVRFIGALILTHNATSLKLPGGANITTAAGDTALFESLGAGNWWCHAYQRAASPPVSGTHTGTSSGTNTGDNPGVTSVATSGLATGGTITGTGTIDVPGATQSVQESGTSTITVVTPGVQRYHPSACKAWIDMNGTGTIANNASYGVSSITDNGTGLYTITFSPAFSTAFYAAVATGGDTGTVNSTYIDQVAGKVAGSCRFQTVTTTTGVAVDPNVVCMAFFGDI